MIDDDDDNIDDEDEEAEQDTRDKLCAIANPDKFVAEPGDMEPDEAEGEGAKRWQFPFTDDVKFDASHAPLCLAWLGRGEQDG